MKKNSYTKEELLKCGEGKLNGIEHGKLPLPPMLMTDRIIEINKNKGDFDKGQIIAELDITNKNWFFHFVYFQYLDIIYPFHLE